MQVLVTVLDLRRSIKKWLVLVVLLSMCTRLRCRNTTDLLNRRRVDSVIACPTSLEVLVAELAVVLVVTMLLLRVALLLYCLLLLTPVLPVK